MKEPVDGKVPRTSGPEAGVSTATLGEGEYRPKSSTLLGRLIARWNRLSLERRFLVAAALSVGLSMLTLGYWIERQVRSGWLQGMAETGAIYLEAILSPHLDGLSATGKLSDPERTAIAALIGDTRLGGRVAMIKIWSTDGDLLFSTSPAKAGEKLSPVLVQRVKSGQVAVDIERDESGQHSPVPATLLEIYAPLHKAGTREIIAIGEFYEFSRSLEAEILRVKYATWLLIFIVALIISILLFVTVKRASRIITAQQNQLESNLARAAALAKRNNSLRRAADRARLKAAVLNENHLAHIGADLHDGPIQMLSLLMLKLPEVPASADSQTVVERRELEKLIHMTLGDLRNLSSGLVLPELKDCSFEETIRLVITRHQQQTATTVRIDLGALPDSVSDAVKVCAYRIIQEALTNAYKHAGGAAQLVRVRVVNGMATIAISNGGGLPRPRTTLAHTPSLGLRGMEARVQALRGTLSIIRDQQGGTEVVAQIPVQPQAESGPAQSAAAGPLGGTT